MPNSIQVHEYFVIEATNASTNLGGHQFSAPLHKGDYVSLGNNIYEIVAVVALPISDINKPDKLPDSDLVVHNGGDLIVKLIGSQSDFNKHVELQFAFA